MLFAAWVICGSAGHHLWVTSGCLSSVACHFPGKIANPQKRDKIWIHCQSLIRAHRDVRSFPPYPTPPYPTLPYHTLPYLLCTQKKGLRYQSLSPLSLFFFSRGWDHSSLHWKSSTRRKVIPVDLFSSRPSVCTVLITVVCNHVAVDKKDELIHLPGIWEVVECNIDQMRNE